MKKIIILLFAVAALCSCNHNLEFEGWAIPADDFKQLLTFEVGDQLYYNHGATTLPATVTSYTVDVQRIIDQRSEEYGTELHIVNAILQAGELQLDITINIIDRQANLYAETGDDGKIDLDICVLVKNSFTTLQFGATETITRGELFEYRLVPIWADEEGQTGGDFALCSYGIEDFNFFGAKWTLVGINGDFFEEEE